jgi:Leucine-rich repeat (LRR) protein
MVSDLASNSLSGGLDQMSALVNLKKMYVFFFKSAGFRIQRLNEDDDPTIYPHRRDLFDNRIAGRFPDLSNLTDLQEMNLGKNRISGPIPASLGSLVSLRYLYLSKNQFDRTIPPELGNLTQLRSLQLFENNLEGTLPESVYNLKALEEFNLDNNLLSGEISENVGQLTHLRSL